MFIQTEVTPNPQTLKFLPGRVVMEEDTSFFQNIAECTHSPFAKRLFNLGGISGVFFGSDFISITKEENQEWQILKPIVLGAITDHFNSGEKVINKKSLELRRYLIENEDRFQGDYDTLLANFLDYLYEQKLDDLKKKEMIAIIADHLYKSAFVVDREINAFACFINLERLD